MLNMANARLGFHMQCIALCDALNPHTALKFGDSLPIACGFHEVANSKSGVCLRRCSKYSRLKLISGLFNMALYARV